MNNLELLKAALSIELEKNGSSILELEDIMSSMDKGSSIIRYAKIAAMLDPLLKQANVNPIDVLKDIGLVFGAGALGVGALAGGGAVLANRSMDSYDKGNDEKRREIEETKQLIEELQKGQSYAN